MRNQSYQKNSGPRSTGPLHARRPVEGTHRKARGAPEFTREALPVVVARAGRGQGAAAQFNVAVHFSDGKDVFGHCH